METTGTSSKESLVDLTSRTFGELKAIRYIKESKKWLCECSCGNTVLKRSWDLRNGRSKTCGDSTKHTSRRLKDISGEKFGELRAIEYIRSGTSGVRGTWLCECSCGNTIYVEPSLLLSGRKKSCGHDMNNFKIIDISNQEFGELTALTRDSVTGKWDCVCSCGKHRLVYISRLRNGSVTSCGHEYNPLIDLTNQRFGKLKVISYDRQKNKWLCECDCGNRKYIYGQHLRRGDTTSCGCTKTFLNIDDLEKTIENLREQLGRKPYIFEVSYTLDCNENIIRKLLKEKYEDTSLLGKCRYRSKFEMQVAEFIRQTYTGGNIEESNRTILDGGLEIDILTPVVAIECNGNYYHSNKFKETTYHQDKVMQAKSKGIRLIHIYEHEWNNEESRGRIKKYLEHLLNSNDTIIYARNTVVEEINTQEAKEFLEKNHLQGYSKAKIKIALKHNDKIVSVMTFDSSRYDSKYQYEMVRYCTLSGYSVTGGARKLFKYFINKYNAESIVSYCNMDKFSGGVYTKLGFSLTGITKPGYFWSNHKATHVLSRYQTRKEMLIELGLGDETQTEDEIMDMQGYIKIYNSGNLKFEWYKEEK